MAANMDLITEETMHQTSEAPGEGWSVILKILKEVELMYTSKVAISHRKKKPDK